MEYRNIKTGAIIKSECEIKGGAWELVKAPKPTPSPKKAPKKSTETK